MSCPPRIQKFFICLQKYEFDLKYSPRKTMLVSDALIRAYIKNSKPEFDENSLIHHIHFVISNLPISNELLEQLKEETRKDPILQTLIKYTIKGWSEKTLVSHELHPYFTHCSDHILPLRATSQRSANYCPQCSKIRNEVHITPRTFRH